MDFGDAIRALKNGAKVCRSGWNGRGMWLLFVSSDQWSTSVGQIRRLPWIGMKTVDGQFVPWLASQTDMLAEDWMTVE
jgi:hypothetical protein